MFKELSKEKNSVVEEKLMNKFLEEDLLNNPLKREKIILFSMMDQLLLMVCQEFIIC